MEQKSGQARHSTSQCHSSSTRCLFRFAAAADSISYQLLPICSFGSQLCGSTGPVRRRGGTPSIGERPAQYDRVRPGGPPGASCLPAAAQGGSSRSRTEHAICASRVLKVRVLRRNVGIKKGMSTSTSQAVLARGRGSAVLAQRRQTLKGSAMFLKGVSRVPHAGAGFSCARNKGLCTLARVCALTGVCTLARFILSESEHLGPGGPYLGSTSRIKD
jgi:hypothetical protein